MHRFTPAICLLLMVAGFVRMGHAQVPEIPYDSAPNLLKMPVNIHLGEVSGVATNSKKHIFVFSRGNTTGPAFAASAAQLLEFGPDGAFIREIGKNLYAWSYAHDVRIDKDDNIWAIDKGSDMIIKFNTAGRVVMVFGRKKEASEEIGPWTKVSPPRPAVDGQFRQPTDVAWDPQGNIYISDGYINSRVAKYDKNGDWVKSWGSPGTKPGEFDLVHGIAADAKGNLYVADRQNKRIQVFDTDGKFLREIKIEIPAPPNAKWWMATGPAGTPAPPQHQPGSPWAVCISPGPTQYLYASDAFPGRIYKMTLDGKVVGMLGSSGRQLKQFGWIHQMACPSENEIYVAELLNWRIQKLTLHPTK